MVMIAYRCRTSDKYIKTFAAIKLVNQIMITRYFLLPDQPLVGITGAFREFTVVAVV